MEPIERHASRLAALALGIAAIVYGTASLTGGWLGTPPWLVPISAEVWLSERHPGATWSGDVPPKSGAALWNFRDRQGRDVVVFGWRDVQYRDLEARTRLSYVVVLLGALAAAGAWPRRPLPLRSS